MDQSRTDELLLSLLRTDLERSWPTGIAGLSGGEWEDLLHVSRRHHVTPLLYHRLSNSCPDLPIAAEVLQSLRSGYLQSAARNVDLYHELGKVLGRLRQDDIQVIALKGAHLAAVVYDNIALRPMNDVDLLVRRADVGRAEGVLLGMGYRAAEHNRSIAKDNYHFTYALSGKGLVVELHWDFVPSSSCFTIDMNEVWERSGQSVLAGEDVMALSPEDHLLYLCLHTSKHLFDGMGLISFCDISRLIRHYGEELDWKQVRLGGERWGIEKSVHTALTLAAQMLGVYPPQDLMEAVQPIAVDQRLMLLGREQIFACGHRTPDDPGVSSTIAHLFGPHENKSKAALFLRRVFPPLHEMSRWYPAPPDSLGIYCYYPARIRDLLLRYGRQAWRLVRRDAAARRWAERENEITMYRDVLMSPGRSRGKAREET